MKIDLVKWKKLVKITKKYNITKNTKLKKLKF